MGGDQSGIGCEFGVEGSGADKHGGIMIDKLDAVLLNPIEIRHIFRREHPGVDGLQHNEQRVFSGEDAGHVIVGVILLGRRAVIGVQFLIDRSVLHPVVQTGGHRKAAPQVLVDAADGQGTVYVVHILIDVPVGIDRCGIPDNEPLLQRSNQPLWFLW